jgi:hypothetical protein
MRSCLHLFCLFVAGICLFSSRIVSAQTRPRDHAIAGSAEHAMRMYEFERKIIESRQKYQSAKKITLLANGLVESTPPSSRRLDVSEAISIGQTGRLWWKDTNGWGITFTVQSVVDKSNVLLAASSKYRIWLEGYPTDNLVDGDNVAIVDYVKIVGTKTYSSENGSQSTVWLVNLLPREDTENRLAEDKSNQPANEKDSSPRETIERLETIYRLSGSRDGDRSWILKNGKQVQGKFLELKDTKLFLQSREGKTFEIKYSTLTEGEQALAKKMQKEINGNKEIERFPSKESTTPKSAEVKMPSGVGPTVSEVIASDDFSSYIPGKNGLLGQAAGGTGFTGTWQSGVFKSNLDVFANPPSVGSVGTSGAGNAGNSLNFVSPLNIRGRQLFIRYKYVNLNKSKAHESSRLDLNHSNAGHGNRVFLGSFVTDNLRLVLEPNLHTGSGNLIVDSGISTVSGTGSHVVLGLLDEQFKQIAVWVDPDMNDFYDPLTGANSANAVAFWSVPKGGLTNFVSYSLVRNYDNSVSFDDVVFARDFGAAHPLASTTSENETMGLHLEKASLPESSAKVMQSGVGTAKENRTEAKLAAEILDVKIVSEPNARGRTNRVVKVTWKNTGNRTIRALDGNFFIADNTGTLKPKFEYTIFACSNLEAGVKPGETFVLTEGGFVLPNGCTASQAKVEITKVLEESNF